MTAIENGYRTEDTAEHADPRETMSALPGFVQLPLTLFTGKALPGQQAPSWWTPGFHLYSAVLGMFLGVAAGCTGLALGGLWLSLVPVGWAVTLHGMRNLRMMIYHQCSHRNMYRRSRLDTAIGRCTSGLLIIQNFARYSREHVSDHHAAHHMTLRDPTVQAFLVSLGLHPGMTRRQMWRRVIGKIISPWFHLNFAVARARSFWSGSAGAEKAVCAGLYGTALIVALVTGTWVQLLLVWFVPLVPLFQVSNTLRLCVKHTFPASDLTVRRGKEYFGGLTNAIFIGESAPRSGLPVVRRVAAWTRWGLRMVFVHAPARYLVLTGDTVVHDFHHRYPATPKWAHYIFERQADLEKGSPGWPPYKQAWGLVPAINLVFDSLSVADPREYNVERLREVSKRELFAAFDD
ncbi:stearoyl-CoA 9-desaturase [Streptomyces sp. NPDC002734]|uniref:stearoyl-CoA 9-desaturase n=1 Tax=Streptomyces sp. NPDC002734 TaxID=3154426 RepID=UPI0033251FC1